MIAEDRSRNKASSDAPSSPGPGTEPSRPRIPPEERLRRIEEAAYYRSLRRSGGDDRALDDWLQAEEEIDRELVKTEPSPNSAE